MIPAYKKVFGFLLSTIYIAVGILGVPLVGLDKPYQYALTSLFVIYGLFRFYRAVTSKVE